MARYETIKGGEGERGGQLLSSVDNFGSNAGEKPDRREREKKTE